MVRMIRLVNNKLHFIKYKSPVVSINDMYAKSFYASTPMIDNVFPILPVSYLTSKTSAITSDIYSQLFKDITEMEYYTFSLRYEHLIYEMGKYEPIL
jgi:hypothetical protein